MEPLAYLNGKFLPQSEARLTLHDAGFVMGATITDLCRTFHHRLYRWQDHLARFRRSSALTGIAVASSDAQLTQAAQRLAEHHAATLTPGQELALVVFATPGPIGYYLSELGEPGDGTPTLGMHTFTLPFARYQKMLTEGAKLTIPSIRHVPVDCIPRGAKQRSRMAWWLAEQEARRRNAQALLLDDAGCLTETAAANFLLVRDGEILSPPKASILEGISLQVVRELAAELGIAFREDFLTPADLTHASEAMVTSTPYCLASVRSVDQVSFTCPGPVASKLLAAWCNQVGVDIHGQILLAN